MKHKHTTNDNHIFGFPLRLVFVFLLACYRHENQLCTEELEKKKRAIDDSASELRRQLKEAVDAREEKGRGIKECTK
jgi:hypothetical protein